MKNKSIYFIPLDNNTEKVMSKVMKDPLSIFCDSISGYIFISMQDMIDRIKTGDLGEKINFYKFNLQEGTSERKVLVYVKINK